jgi:hypothetical protein
MVEDTERFEVGGGRLTSAFMIVCRGIESIDCAFLRCDKRRWTCPFMSKGGGFVVPRPEILGGDVEEVTPDFPSLPEIVE